MTKKQENGINTLEMLEPGMSATITEVGGDGDDGVHDGVVVHDLGQQGPGGFELLGHGIEVLLALRDEGLGIHVVLDPLLDDLRPDLHVLLALDV